MKHSMCAPCCPPCLYRQQGSDELRRWERSEVVSGPGAAHYTPLTEAHTIHTATGGGQDDGQDQVGKIIQSSQQVHIYVFGQNVS